MANQQLINQRAQEMLMQQVSFSRFFDKFTEQARQALVFADEEAALCNHTYIGTEHILLGLLRENTGLATTVLKEVGVDLENVRTFVERVVQRGEPLPEGEAIQRPLTPRTQVVITMAIGESWRSSYIGTEHLLLALLREGQGLAAGAIEAITGSLDLVRTNLYKAMMEQGLPTEPLKDIIKKSGMTNKSNVITCRVDDLDLNAIDALVEVGIRSTRSDAAAWLIHAGIAAHQNVLETIYSTVAEIRTLRTKAQALAHQITLSEPATPSSSPGNSEQ